jgi:hypothetical protein
MPLQQAAQRMTPIDPRRFVAPRGAAFLQQFIREQERDDQQGYDEKRAQNQVLDHDGLRIAGLQGSFIILGS